MIFSSQSFFHEASPLFRTLKPIDVQFNSVNERLEIPSAVQVFVREDSEQVTDVIVEGGCRYE